MGESVKLEDVLDAVDAVIRQRVPLHLQGNTALDEVRERLSALPRAGEGGEERLREALEPFAAAAGNYDDDAPDDMDVDDLGCSGVTVGYLRAARAALHSSREG